MMNSDYLMNDINNVFFELIRVAVGTQEGLSRPLSAEEWSQMYDMSRKQCMVGVCFAGLQRMAGGMAHVKDNPVTQNLSKRDYMQWLALVARIQQRNEAMDAGTVRVLEFFRERGYACRVLKGQGVARLYGQQLAGLRQPGDVDVWLDCTRRELYRLSRKECGRVEGITYHHVHFNKWKDVEVEAHIHPSYLSSPIRNRALQRFCELHKPTGDVGGSGDGGLDIQRDAPSLAFNRVFILLHCYRHFCGHGIGLRQLLDYYYVLLQGFSEEERRESMRWIDRLGMAKFCRATMWLMREVFGMEERYMLCEPDADNGRFLLEEVLRSGNFGNGDERDRISSSALQRYLYNLKRDACTIGICPHESLWDPLFNVYRFVMTKYFWKG